MESSPQIMQQDWESSPPARKEPPPVLRHRAIACGWKTAPHARRRRGESEGNLEPVTQLPAALPNREDSCMSTRSWDRFLVRAVCILAACFACTELASPKPCLAQKPSTPTNQTPSAKRVLLDLSKKETFILLATRANPRNVMVCDVEIDNLPTEHRFVPASVTARFGHPLDIELKEPDNVRIRLAIVKRGKQLALKISPQVVLSQNNVVDLTKDRIARTQRTMHRRLRDLNRQLIAMSRERRALNLWLITPGNKALESVETAHMRMKILDQAIREKRRQIPMAGKACLALAQAGKFVKKLHKNVEIQYSITVVGAQVARRQGGD